MATGDGILVTLIQAKAYLEIDHDADDTLLGDLISTAEGRLQSFCKVPIDSKEFEEYHDGGVGRMLLRKMPVDPESITVVDTKGTIGDDTDDEELEAAYWRLYPERGVLARTTSNGRPGIWSEGIRRWKITYKAGMTLHTDWSYGLKEDIIGTVRDLVAEWYEKPLASLISEGSGPLKRTFETVALPDRILRVWTKLKAN